MNGFFENYIEDYKDLNDIKDEDEEGNYVDNDDQKIMDSPEYKDYIYDQIYDYLNQAVYDIEDNIQNNHISLYRAMTVADDWLQKLQKGGVRLGIYWTYDEDRPEAYWADPRKKNTAIITSSVDEKYVNWHETLRMNANPSFTDEKEIRLFKNTPLKIINITINDVEQDISSIMNKTFYA